MVLRLRVRLRRGDREVEAVAIVNSGYESSGPEILIPSSIARELGIYPTLPAGAEVAEYLLADGSRARLIRVRDGVEVAVVVEDRELRFVRSSVVIAEGQDVLISDKLADELGIVALALGKGLWCFSDEVGKKVRGGV